MSTYDTVLDHEAYIGFPVMLEKNKLCAHLHHSTETARNEIFQPVAFTCYNNVQNVIDHCTLLW